MFYVLSEFIKINKDKQLVDEFIQENKKLVGMWQMMETLEWKRNNITMFFVVGYPRKTKAFNTIWVIITRLTKSIHFFLININFSFKKLMQLYIKKSVKLNRVPSSIISCRDSRFTS
ncbi:hypothetical protein CR513_05128, partial [Mucuna pruriens]